MAMENKHKKVRAPSKTVFDAQHYQPEHPGDKSEVETPITYEKYKFN